MYFEDTAKVFQTQCLGGLAIIALSYLFGLFVHPY